jgi:hypothetical protein
MLDIYASYITYPLFDVARHKMLHHNGKTHTYSISVKQSLFSIILHNGFSNIATDINDFLCKILGYSMTLKIISRKFLGVSLIWTFFSHVGAIFF